MKNTTFALEELHISGGAYNLLKQLKATTKEAIVSLESEQILSHPNATKQNHSEILGLIHSLEGTAIQSDLAAV